MYNAVIEKRKVSELMEGIEGGLIIREGLQRTPSHDLKKSADILTSAFDGKYAGCLHFAKLEDGTLSILDGSSRLQDFQDFIGNKEGTYLKKSVFDTDKDKEVIEKVSFSELTETEKDKILNYSFPCVILEGINNNETFVALNSSVSLNNIQKVKGNLSQDFIDILELLKNSSIVKNTFSERQLQKDEVVSMCFQILGNIYNCYSASNKRLVENVKNTNLINFNIERLSNILDKFNSIDVDTNKYCVISLVSVLYNSPLNVDDIPTFDNNIIFKIDTAGANSNPANEKRLAKAVKKLNDTLGVSVKNGRKILKNESMGVEVEETEVNNETDLLELIK